MPTASQAAVGFSLSVRRRGCTTSRRFNGGNMRVILALGAIVTAGILVSAADAPPPWAYGFAGPAPATPPAAAPAAPGGRAGGPPAAAPAPDESLKHLPGSTGAFTLAQIRDAFGPADWYPGDHPTMPEVVAHGKRPDVRACSLCHYPNGKGRPENAGVSGLPVSYFMQTMADFRNGGRKSADARKANTNVMIAIAKGMTEDETQRRGRVLRLDEVDAVDQGRRGGHGAEDANRRRDVSEDRRRRDRADRRSHHRDAGGRRGAPNRCAIRGPASSRTCRRAASRGAKRS